MLTDEKKRSEYRRAAVLAVRGGESKTAVAARLHVSRETIYTWLERADPQTGEGDLHDPGPRSRMDASMRERLAALIDKGPRACGFDFDAWTLPRLAAAKRGLLGNFVAEDLGKLAARFDQAFDFPADTVKGFLRGALGTDFNVCQAKT
jgi:transposase